MMHLLRDQKAPPRCEVGGEKKNPEWLLPGKGADDIKQKGMETRGAGRVRARPPLQGIPGARLSHSGTVRWIATNTATPPSCELELLSLRSLE